MTMTRFGRRAVLFIAAVLCCGLMFSQAVYANSAPIQIDPGDPARGVIPREASPLAVEKELLTFDIPVLRPEDNDYDIDGAAERSGTVTAQYYFKNPSSEDVTLKLAFAHGFRRTNTSCEVKLDEQVLETAIRYTYTDSSAEFYGPDDVERIRDDYAEDEFLSPDMSVTEYVFDIGGLSDGESADAVFDYSLPEGGGTRLIVPCNYRDNGECLRKARNGDSISVYALGDTGGIRCSWDIISASGEKMTVSPKTGREMSLLELAVLTMQDTPDISGIDSYNIVAEGLNNGRHSDLYYSYLPDGSFDTVMWIEYGFTLKAGAEAVNSVKAVLAPECYNRRRDPEYTYSYLLSPAQCWKEFGSLDIVINTPHRMQDEGEGDYKKTENGFTRHFDSLPDGELSFTLIPAEDSPSRGSDTSGIGGTVAGVLLVGGLAVAGVILLIVVIVVIIMVSAGRKKKHGNKP